MSKTLNLVRHGTTLAARWYRQGRTSDARRLLNRLTNLNLPADADSAAHHYRLAVLYLRLRHFRRARRHLARTLQADKTHARAHFRLALALEHDPRADPERIVRQYRRALDLVADRPLWWAAYGRCLAGLGRTTAGLGAVREAVALAPDDPRLTACLIRALLRAGRPAEAEQVAITARFRHPHDGRVARLWERLRFRQALRRQRAGQRGERSAVEPVVLPFVRLVETPVVRRTVGRVLRRDRASQPAPHLPRLLGRKDRKQAP
jgi:tetratricopeptide (TPR) repeat protein